MVHERNQEVVLVVGMGLVILFAFLTALFCYLGLAHQNELPNGLTFFTGVLCGGRPDPAAGRVPSRRAPRRARTGQQPQTTTVAGLPPGAMPSPPTSASIQDTIPRRNETGGGALLHRAPERSSGFERLRPL